MSYDFHEVPSEHSTVIHAHSRSFSLASRLLPRQMRRQTRLLYAWCRWCDDAVDQVATKDEAERQLATLREDVDRVYRREEPTHQASLWLAEVATRCNIPRDLPLDLLRGMEMDLHDSPVHSVDDLLLYCYHAAGCVGLMMCHVMGVTSREALQQASDLGTAMQLTNIARDVLEDWERGRCYLPDVWLERELGSAPPDTCRVKPAVAKTLSLADEYYQHGRQGIPRLPKTAQPAIQLAAKLYQAIGHEIRRHDHEVMAGRVCLPRWRVAAIASVPAVQWLLSRIFDGLPTGGRKSMFLPPPIATLSPQDRR